MAVRPAILAPGLLALAACTPADPPEVALCKFALARTVADAPARLDARVTDSSGVTAVHLAFTDAGTPTTATCTVRVTPHGVRLRSLTIAGTPVPERTLAPIRADWASKEDAEKLYQL